MDGGVSPLGRFSACVVLFIPRMDKPLMADEEVASSEGLGAYFADKWLLFGVRSYMALEVFLRHAGQYYCG